MSKVAMVREEIGACKVARVEVEMCNDVVWSVSM